MIKIGVQLSFFMIVPLFAQSQINSSSVFLTDVKGVPITTNTESDISGSPFFISSWSNGDITIKNGAVVNDVSIKLNLFTNEVHYLGGENGKMELVANRGSIRAIMFKKISENGVETLKFRIGFPAINSKNLESFYLVICEGNCVLVKSISKKIQEIKPFNSAVTEKKFVEDENLYLFKNNKIIRVKKNKDFIIEHLNDRQEIIQKYVSENKLKCKTENDLVRIVNYYNGLE